jgi:flagellar export protein FliJ
MKRDPAQSGLGQLVAMRAQDVERLRRDVAARDAEGDRHRRQITQMNGLLHTTACGPGMHPAQAINGARYRAALADLIHHQEHRLALHEADLATLRASLRAARLRHEQLDSALRKRVAALEVERHARERKHEDQLATQAWLRQRRLGDRAHSHPS